MVILRYKTRPLWSLDQPSIDLPHQKPTPSQNSSGTQRSAQKLGEWPISVIALIFVILDSVRCQGTTVPEFPYFYALSFALPIISPDAYTIGETWYIRSYNGLGATKKPLMVRQVPINPGTPGGAIPPQYEYLDYFYIESLSTPKMQGGFSSPITSNIVPYFRMKPCSDLSCLISDVEHAENTSYLLMALGSQPDKQIAKFNLDTCEPPVYVSATDIIPGLNSKVRGIAFAGSSRMIVTVTPVAIWKFDTLELLKVVPVSKPGEIFDVMCLANSDCYISRVALASSLVLTISKISASDDWALPTINSVQLPEVTPGSLGACRSAKMQVIPSQSKIIVTACYSLFFLDVSDPAKITWVGYQSLDAIGNPVEVSRASTFFDGSTATVGSVDTFAGGLSLAIARIIFGNTAQMGAGALLTMDSQILPEVFQTYQAGFGISSQAIRGMAFLDIDHLIVVPVSGIAKVFKKWRCQSTTLEPDQNLGANFGVSSCSSMGQYLYPAGDPSPYDYCNTPGTFADFSTEIPKCSRFGTSGYRNHFNPGVNTDCPVQRLNFRDYTQPVAVACMQCNIMKPSYIFYANNTCSSCSTACATCIDTNACTSCLAGSKLDPIAMTCISAAPQATATAVGFEFTYVACPPNCAACIYPNTCSLCKQNFYWAPTERQCLDCSAAPNLCSSKTTVSVTVAAAPTSLKPDSVDLAFVLTLTHNLTAADSPTVAQWFAAKVPLQAVFVRSSDSQTETVAAQLESGQAGSAVIVSLTVTGTTHTRDYSVSVRLADPVFVDVNATHLLAVSVFSVSAPYSAPATQGEIAASQTQGSVVGGLAAVSPVQNNLVSTVVTVAMNTDPSGTLTRATQILKILNRLAYVNVQFGPRLAAFLGSLEDYAQTLKEPTSTHMQRLARDSRGVLTRRRVVVRLQSQLHWKLALFGLTWLLRRLASVVCDLRPRLPRGVLLAVYWVPKVHLLVLNSFMVDLWFYATRTLLHAADGGSRVLAAAVLVCVSVDTCGLVAVCLEGGVWRWVFGRNHRLDQAKKGLATGADNQPGNAPEQVDHLQGSVQRQGANQAPKLGSGTVKEGGRSDQSVGDDSKHLILVDTAHLQNGTSSKSLNRHPNLDGTYEEPPAQPQRRVVDYPTTYDRLAADLHWVELVAGPLALRRDVYESAALRANFAVHVVRVAVYQVVVVSTAQCAGWAVGLLAVVEAGRIALSTWLFYKYRNLSLGTIYASEISQSIFLLIFLLICFSLVPKSRQDKVSDGVQTFSILLILFASIFEYIILMVHIGFLVVNLVKTFRLKKNQHELARLKELYDPIRMIVDPSSGDMSVKTVPRSLSIGSEELSQPKQLDSKTILANFTDSKAVQMNQLEKQKPTKIGTSVSLISHQVGARPVMKTGPKLAAESNRRQQAPKKLIQRHQKNRDVKNYFAQDSIFVFRF